MKHSNWILVAVVLGLVPSAWLIGKGLKRKPAGEYVSVTGMAEVDFTSDLIVWSADYSRTSFESKTAFQQITDDEKAVLEFLHKKGLNDTEIIVGTINVNKEFDYVYENGNSRRVFLGYKASQTVTVKSKQVAKVEEVAKASMSLVEKGIEFNSHSPYFYYTKLADLKVSLIEKATQDARLRAVKIAQAAGSKLGDLKKSDLGVFQITGQYENEEYSWGGAFNTTSKLKTARVTVSCSYKPD